MTHKILFAAQEPANLSLLENLCGNDFQVISAVSAIKALELLRTNSPALIISDQFLPDLTAAEFLKKAAELCPSAIRILSADGDSQMLFEAINSGVAHKYVAKPWIISSVERTISGALAQFQESEMKRQGLVLKNDPSTEKTSENLTYFIPLSADLINSKTETDAAAGTRIAIYATAIGQRLGLPANEIEKLTMTAFNQKRQASALKTPKGYFPANNEGEICEPSIKRNAISPETIETAERDFVIRHIGEHFDGSGFPDRLAGERIPLHSRIIAVANAYDEAVSAININQVGAHNQAIFRLKREAGTILDPALVSCFCRIETLGQIRRLIGDGFIGLRRLSVRIFCDAGEVNLAEMLDKIKTTPMLAMETLHLANERHPASPTAQLMTAAKKLGETGLRQMLNDYGFPLSDPHIKNWAELALRRGCAAQALAASTDVLNPEIAYTLGLLQDVGEILLAAVFPAEMRELVEIRDEQKRFYREIELFGVESAQISRWMLEDCGIKPNLAAAVNSRHRSMRGGDPISILLFAAQHIAAASEENKTRVFDEIGKTALDILRLDRNDLVKIYNQTIAASAELIRSHAEIFELVETALN